jgi:hypothetical protein
MNKEKLIVKYLILLYLLKSNYSSSLGADKRLRNLIVDVVEGDHLAINVSGYVSLDISPPPCPQPNFFVNNPG